MAVLGFGRLALDRKNRDTPISHQRSRNIVLRGKRIGCYKPRFTASGLQRSRKIGRLSGYMSTGNKLHTLQGLFVTESLSDQTQDRHLTLGPFDSLFALLSQADILYVIFE